MSVVGRSVVVVAWLFVELVVRVFMLDGVVVNISSVVMVRVVMVVSVRVMSTRTDGGVSLN